MGNRYLLIALSILVLAELPFIQNISLSTKPASVCYLLTKATSLQAKVHPEIPPTYIPVKYENQREAYPKSDPKSWYTSQWASPPPLLFNYDKNQVKKCWLQIANSEWSEVNRSKVFALIAI
jgi:hypothetical protein